jgi:hypothetical protein
MSPAECPFCTEWAEVLRTTNPIAETESLVVTHEQFMKHVGNHMVDLALFALPRNLGDEDELDSNLAIDLHTQRSSLASASLQSGIENHNTQRSLVDYDAPGGTPRLSPEWNLLLNVTLAAVRFKAAIKPRRNSQRDGRWGHTVLWQALSH